MVSGDASEPAGHSSAQPGPPPLERWSTYLIASAMLLTAAAAIWVFAEVDVFMPALGIVIGLGLGGLWWPLPPKGSVSPTALTRAPQPFMALWRVFAPLLLPLLVVVVAGTVESAGWVELVVGVLSGLVAWGAVLRYEMPALKAILPVIGRAGRAFWIAVAVIAIPALIVAIGFGVAGDEIEPFEDKGGWSSALLLFAAYLWAAAALIRLIGFATSWLRFVEAVALGALLTRLVMAAGILPGHDSGLGDTLSVGLLAAIVAALLLVEVAIGAWAVIKGRVASVTPIVTEKGALSLESTQRVRAFGTGTALVASLALGAAVVVGIEESTDEGEGRTTLAGEEIHSTVLDRTPAEMLPADREEDAVELVETYQPYLAFREDQQWVPEAVDEFVLESELRGPDETVPAGLTTVDSLPIGCPGVQPSPCYQLTIECETADECTKDDDDQPALDSEGFDTPIQSGAVYVRVIRRGELPKAFPSRIGDFEGEIPSILIQYWYFYPYDEWRTPILAGELVQRHEADWEVVMVGLSQRRPLFVAYSQHCTGEWVDWEEVQVAEAEPRTHPLVAVARGSQANYPNASQQRAPDWGKCAGVPEGTVAVTSYASNIRDLTGYGFSWIPAETRFVDANTPPMTFPGTWGANGGAQLENARTFSLEKGGEPETPSMQPQWTDPLTTALCDWRGPDDVPDRC